MPTAIDTAALQEALSGLAGQVANARPSAPGPGDLGPARRRRLAWHLDDYLLPRVRDLEAPLVCVLLGSTGAGKSSLLNGLAGAAVSPSGVVRPTTMRPVVLLAPGQVDAFMAGRVLPALADADRLQLVVHDQAFPEIALVDAPDVDSVEAENRRTAEELLQAADLCLFVTTAQRYADYVPWEFLRQARARGVPLLLVVNRLPRREDDRRAVLDDARRRFEEAGLGTAGPGGRDLPMLGVVEGARDPETDGLEASAIEPVHRALAELSADTAALTAVKAAQGRPRPAADKGAGVGGAGGGPGPPRRRGRRPRRHRVVGRPGGGAAAGGQPRPVGARTGAGGRGQGAAHPMAGQADQERRGAGPEPAGVRVRGLARGQRHRGGGHAGRVRPLGRPDRRRGGDRRRDRGPQPEAARGPDRRGRGGRHHPGRRARPAPPPALGPGVRRPPLPRPARPRRRGPGRAARGRRPGPGRGRAPDRQPRRGPGPWLVPPNRGGAWRRLGGGGGGARGAGPSPRA